MKANEFNIRPSSKNNSEYSVYWHYEINHAKELYSGSMEYCQGMINMIQEALTLIRDKVYSEFTEEKFCDFEDVENEILNINIGALNFEFVSRDLHDGEGGEVNCECYSLGKDTGYGITEEERDGVSGIPYDDEYCMNYYFHEVNHDFEKTRDLIIDELQRYVIGDAEKLCRAVEKEFTWDSLKEQGRILKLIYEMTDGYNGSYESYFEDYLKLKNQVDKIAWFKAQFGCCENTVKAVLKELNVRC